MAPDNDEMTLNVQAAIDDAVKKGKFPDRNSAIIGLMKELIGYQKGALKGKLKGTPVEGVENLRAGTWKALMDKAGGDEDKAVQLYVDELKKLKI
jgi:hypothetical protein